MSDYYKNKQIMNIEINTLVNTKKSGDIIKFCDLANTYGQRFGFGIKTIISSFKILRDQNKVLLFDEYAEVL
jgi:hypothetical protein